MTSDCYLLLIQFSLVMLICVFLFFWGFAAKRPSTVCVFVGVANKIFHNKTRFCQYLATNPALHKILEGKHQPKEIGYANKNTDNGWSHSNTATLISYLVRVASRMDCFSVSQPLSHLPPFCPLNHHCQRWQKMHIELIVLHSTLRVLIRNRYQGKS